MKTKGKVCLGIVIFVLISLIIAKVIFTNINCREFSSPETEKQDILGRRDFLLKKLMVSPEEVIAEMPSAVGPQFQGEWALYSCSMLSAALVNIANKYPEEKDTSLSAIDSLIKIVMSPELRRYDAERWGEDPIETLEGNNSHISYLSHLAWMIGGYKSIGGGHQYDRLFDSLCSTMFRRLQSRENLSLKTYPGEYIYVPDVAVAYVALSYYSNLNKGRYQDIIDSWCSLLGTECTDRETGIVPSFMPDCICHNYLPIKGSYTALTCYYLTFINEQFAKEQYEKLKENFLKKHPFVGFKEYYDKWRPLALDIDAGPIIFNLSPTGTAFGLGPVTFFGDEQISKGILRTAEVAGTTVNKHGRHYKLANIALVGEAIALAMRTNWPRNLNPCD